MQPLDQLLTSTFFLAALWPAASLGMIALIFIALWVWFWVDERRSVL